MENWIKKGIEAIENFEYQNDILISYKVENNIIVIYNPNSYKVLNHVRDLLQLYQFILGIQYGVMNRKTFTDNDILKDRERNND